MEPLDESAQIQGEVAVRHMITLAQGAARIMHPSKASECSHEKTGGY